MVQYYRYSAPQLPCYPEKIYMPTLITMKTFSLKNEDNQETQLWGTCIRLYKTTYFTVGHSLAKSSELWYKFRENTLPQFLAEVSCQSVELFLNMPYFIGHGRWQVWSFSILVHHFLKVKLTWAHCLNATAWSLHLRLMAWGKIQTSWCLFLQLLLPSSFFTSITATGS